MSSKTPDAKFRMFVYGAAVTLMGTAAAAWPGPVIAVACAVLAFYMAWQGRPPRPGKRPSGARKRASSSPSFLARLGGAEPRPVSLFPRRNAP